MARVVARRCTIGVVSGANDAKRAALLDKAKAMLAADHFALLGVPRTATGDDVKRAFLALAKEWHPDRVPPGLDDLQPTFASVFARVEQARATLMDPASRTAYVAELAGPAERISLPPVAGNAAQLEYVKAETSLKKSDLAQAEAHALEALRIAPANPDYAALLAWIRASKPNLDDRVLRGLVSDLDKVIAKNPQCERALFYRGMLRKRLDLIPQAMADLAKAADLNPRNLEAVREVRLYRMRLEREGGSAESRATRASTKPASGDEKQEGVGGFIKKLFTRD